MQLKLIISKAIYVVTKAGRKTYGGLFFNMEQYFTPGKQHFPGESTAQGCRAPAFPWPCSSRSPHLSWPHFPNNKNYIFFIFCIFSVFSLYRKRKHVEINSSKWQNHTPQAFEHFASHSGTARLQQHNRSSTTTHPVRRKKDWLHLHWWTSSLTHPE